MMIEHLCDAWETAALVEHVAVKVRCRSAITIGEPGDRPRFAYVSVGSPLEQITGETTKILDRSGTQLALVDLADRLLDGEVAAVLAPVGPVTQNLAGTLPLPDAFVARRQSIREHHVLARFLLRQIGLEEVSSHRGAPADLYYRVRDIWSHDLSMCIDPGMLLGLGADRQRYVDANFNGRSVERLPRALGRLHDLGVRSYPRLVII